MKCRFTLILLLLPVLALPAQAGIIFGKKPPKPDPAQRVPELIKTVRTDGDESKRVEAVEELRQYDPTAFPEIYPALIEALLNDGKAAVRAEAASTIGKLRPVSQDAGNALEMALDKDDSMRVRLAVRSALMQYRWAGFRAGKKEAPPQITTKEPPLADPKPLPPTSTTPPSLPTNPTPIAPPPASVAPLALPQVPALEPPPPPRLVPLKPMPDNSGPDLGGPG
jgi:hypothetical protein